MHLCLQSYVGLSWTLFGASLCCWFANGGTDSHSCLISMTAFLLVYCPDSHNIIFVVYVSFNQWRFALMCNRGKRAGFSSRQELRILNRLSQYITDSQEARKLLGVLLPFLKVKKRMDHGEFECLCST